MAIFAFTLRSLGFLTRSYRQQKKAMHLDMKKKKSISKNNANVSLLICVDINAIEEHVTDPPGSQGEKGNTMCHILILIIEEEEN